MISKRTIRNLLNKSLKKYSLVRISSVFLSEYRVGFIDCLLTMNKPLIAKRYFINSLIEEYDLETPEGCEYFEKGVRADFDKILKGKLCNGVYDED